MFQNLQNSTVQTASEEDVLIAMGGDEATKGKNDKKDDKTSDDKKSTAKPATKSSKSSTAPATATSKAVVSDMDEEDIDAAFGTEEDETDDDDDNEKDTKKKDTKKSSAKKDSKKKEVVKEDEEDEEEVTEDEEDENDEENEEDEDKDKDEDDENEDDSPVTVSDFLKARVNLFLEKGEWKPFKFDGKEPDEIEWDEETFEEIELQQRAWQKENMREELLDSFGPYGRDIAEYANNGGDPEDLLEIFKEQQAVKAIDIATEDGQKEAVFQYQTQILKRKPARANQEIERLIADKMLEEDAKEAKEAIESHLKEQADALKAEQAEAKKNFEKQTAASQKKFSDDVTKLINDNTDITPDEKKSLIKQLTTFKHELPNGTKVNDFYFKFAEFRKNLDNYLEMVRLVNNPERYKKSLKNKGKTDEAERAFKLAKGAKSKNKIKTTSQEGGSGKSKKTGFQLL